MSTQKNTYKQTFAQEDSPGFDAIAKKEKEIYGNQEPTHWGTIVPWELGGEDPLWAIDCFSSTKQQSHFHYVSLGFTNLWYNEDFAEDEVNGFGFELTFRHLPFNGDPEKPIWPVNFLQNIARYVFNSKNVFDDYHIMSANGPIRGDTETDVTAIAFITDPEFGEIPTPHGHVKFIQIFGLTTNEYNNLKTKKYSVKELLDKHRQANPLLITDLERK
jgi:hypothetical protein